MCNCVRWRSDAMDRIAHHNGNRSLKMRDGSFLLAFRIHLPVSPSFLLHVGHEQRVRFFLSTLDAVNGDMESARKRTEVE